MTAAEQVLLSLIKQALFQILASVPENTDWDEVLREARDQAVLGLIGDLVPMKTGSEWERTWSHDISNTYRNLHAQSELTALLSAEKISYAILKGTAAAVYYPAPERRSMGDIDFIVARDHYERTKELLLKAGYSAGSIDDTDRELALFRDGFEFELHYRFSDDLDIEDEIIKGLDKAETAQVDEYGFRMLPPLANGLVLLVHLRHHLLTGLGLRQVIDWMMYADKVLDDDFWWETFEKAAGRIGLDTLAVTVTRMCQLYLGLSEKITWCSEAEPGLCDRLLETLLVSGNFGKKQGSGNKVETVSIRMKREGIFHYLQRAGEQNWMLYKKHHWLKPLCWVYQIGRYMRQWIHTGRGKQITDDIGHSKERYELLKQLKIV